jgi:hypothetical protein
LQAVQIHSANGVKLLEARRGVLSSTPPYKYELEDMWKKPAIDEPQYTILALFEGTEKDYEKSGPGFPVSRSPISESGLPTVPRNSSN